MDPSQKSTTLKWTLHKKSDLKLDLKIKNNNVIFHTHSAKNEFARKILKKFTGLHFFTKI